MDGGYRSDKRGDGDHPTSDRFAGLAKMNEETPQSRSSAGLIFSDRLNEISISQSYLQISTKK